MSERGHRSAERPSGRGRSRRLRVACGRRSARWLAVWTLVPTLLALAGCGDDDSGSSPGGAAKATVKPPPPIASAGRMRFCTDPTYPPAEFLEGRTYAGFDIDIAKEIAGSMGVEAAFVQTGFDGIVAAVKARKCDALIAAMNVTPQREKQLAFVRYGKTGHGLMVAKGKGGGVDTLDDLAGRKVAVQVGTTQKDAIDEASAKLKAAGKPAIEVVTFPKDTDAAAALQAGRVDVYFADGPPIAYYAKRQPDKFEVAATNLTSRPIGIGLTQDDAALRKATQAAVDGLYRSGRMKEILGEWNVPDVALR